MVQFRTVLLRSRGLEEGEKKNGLGEIVNNIEGMHIVNAYIN